MTDAKWDGTPRQQAMKDRIEIENVLLNYFRGLDRADFDLVRCCFAEDAYIEFIDQFTGERDQFVEWLQTPDEMGGCTKSLHFAANMLIEFAEDERTARSETYAIAFHNTVPSHPWGDAFTTMWIRYLDILGSDDGDRWRIERRTAITEWTRFDNAGMWAELSLASRRDRSDPLYGM